MNAYIVMSHPDHGPQVVELNMTNISDVFEWLAAHRGNGWSHVVIFPRPVRSVSQDEFEANY